MLNKKTQVTLFLVLGLVVLIAISFMSYLSADKTKTDIKKEAEITTSSGLPSSLLPLKSNIDFCVDEIGKRAIVYTGLYGGYYKVPEPKLVYFYDGVPYYVFRSANYMPTRETVESQISDYVMEQLPACVNNLQDFQGANVEGAIESVSSTIGKDAVFIHIDYPINIYKGDAKAQFLKFRTEVPVRLDTIYDIASEIVEGKIKNNGALCADCLIDLASENNVFIDVVSHEDSMILTIFDNVTKIDENDYIFSFAMTK
ncbi:hypothetical protein HYW20_07300 [Candidatus Woesearchaeota archaeon]|nr:hypothetical protein [Candidatus Woesearchaeota archaeon]